MLVEEIELLPRAFLVARQVRRRRRTKLERFRDVVGYGGRHVGVNTDQLRWRLKCHLFGDRIAPVAALRDKSRVSEALHQHGPGASHALWIPASRGRLS